MNRTDKFPTLYIPHGGGPCFFMDVPPGRPSDMWDRMAAYLRGIDAAIGRRPQAVLLISGHWEQPSVTVNNAAHPPLLFDYYGFPEHTYRLQYPAPGAPELAQRVCDMLGAAGIPTASDDSRGLDHGVFIPFMLVYPQADVPIVQLSLHASLHAAAHIALGRALAPLREEGVLIVGSGMSYHNLREMFVDDAQFNAPAVEFDAWLTQAVTDPDPRTRDRKLSTWFDAPGARRSHPRPEHLIPLMVAAGAAHDDIGRRTFNDVILGKPISGFQFG